VFVGVAVGVALALADVVFGWSLGNGSSTRGAGDGEFGPTGSVGLASVGVGDRDGDELGEFEGDLLGCLLGTVVGPVVGTGRRLGVVVGETMIDGVGAPEPGA
jgi:hypothetical protein